jgi:hypothetical protein
MASTSKRAIRLNKGALYRFMSYFRFIMTDKQIKQNEFLRKLYEKRIFYPPGIYFADICKELGINNELAIKEILPYLQYKLWIEPVTTEGKFIIIISGIDEIQSQLSSHTEVRDMIYKRNQFLRRLKEIKDEMGQDKDMYELGVFLGCMHYLHQI